MNAPAGPRRVDVAAAYELGVDAYVSLWSPVILPPAQAVVAGLGLEGTPRVLDIGAGPGSVRATPGTAASSVANPGVNAC